MAFLLATLLIAGVARAQNSGFNPNAATTMMTDTGNPFVNQQNFMTANNAPAQFSTCQQIVMPWQEVVGAPCVGQFSCNFDPFCCCPDEVVQSNKYCMNVNTLVCVNGALQHRENQPPPCITNPNFVCPSCVDCSAQAPPKCDDSCQAPRFCDFLPPTCESCAQAVCRDPPTCDNVACRQVVCDPALDLVPFTPAGECCPVDCLLKECMNNSDCNSGFCSKRPGGCDLVGVCEQRPPADLCPELEPNAKPVCGCNGITQAGYCLANAAGINVQAFSTCESLQQTTQETTTKAPQTAPPTTQAATTTTQALIAKIEEDSSGSGNSDSSSSGDLSGSGNSDSSSSGGWWGDDSSSSSSWYGDSSSSEEWVYVKPADIFEIQELGPYPVECSYKLDCQGIVCPATCGGGQAQITCPIINFIPAQYGGRCDVQPGQATKTIPCVNNQACVTDPSVPVDCVWDRYCGDDTDMFPCIGDCGGQPGYRECEVRNFIPAINGGACSKEHNSQMIYRSCINRDPCPVDCTFDLVCEDTCQGRCGSTGHKICTVANFVPQNEKGRCVLPEGAGDGFQVLEECETTPCSQTCPRSIKDYYNHNDTLYVSCEGDMVCEYNEFCCCPDEQLKEDQDCLMVNKLVCINNDWVLEQAEPPPCVSDPENYFCPSAPGGKYCVQCPEEKPECDDSCVWPNYCTYNDATCDTCASAVCTPPPDCTGHVCEDDEINSGDGSLQARKDACPPNKILVTRDGECCGGCERIRCKEHSECDGFCFKEPGECDGWGVCKDVPNAMLCLIDETNPKTVCGCDGKTRMGWCMTNSAYENVDFFGECPPVAPSPKVNFVDDVWPLLMRLNVHIGHNIDGGNAATMLDLSDVNTAFTNLVNIPSKELPTSVLVKPCDAQASYMYHKLANTHVAIGGFGTHMPPNGGVTADELAMVLTWINEGVLFDAQSQPVMVCDVSNSGAIVDNTEDPDACPESMLVWRKNPQLFATCTTGLHCEYDEFCCCGDEENVADKHCINANHLDCVDGVWQYKLAGAPQCVTDEHFLCPTQKKALDPKIPNSQSCPVSIQAWEDMALERTGKGMPLVPCTTEGLHCRYDEFCCCPNEEVEEDKMCQTTNNLYCVDGFFEYVASPKPRCVDQEDFVCPSEPVCVQCPGDLDPTLLPDCDASCISPNYCQYQDRTCETCYQAICMEPPACDDVECPSAGCTENEEEFVPNGECCPVCRPKSCMVNNDCGDKFYCKKNKGECNSQGTCRVMPPAAVCPQEDPEPQAVCGCDGETHLGWCLSAALGINIAMVDVCPVRNVEVAVPAAPGALLFWTDHAFRSPIPVSEISYPRDQIKEWKMHVYWHPNNEAEFAEAMILRDNIILAIKNGVFLAVCPGVTSAIIPGLVNEMVPNIFPGPIGPHPLASYDIWVPQEHLAAVLGFVTVNRGSLSLLVRPVTRFQMEDHVGRAFWLGRDYGLDMSALQVELPIIPKQYPELGLGYSFVPPKVQKPTSAPVTTTTQQPVVTTTQAVPVVTNPSTAPRALIESAVVDNSSGDL